MTFGGIDQNAPAANKPTIAHDATEIDGDKSGPDRRNADA
jgi:hypothetical protein